METPQEAPKTVLIVDDEKELQELIAYALAEDGLKLEFAKNGAAAIEMIAAAKPDLVVLDLMLPRMSGFDVLKQMQVTECKDIPVLVLTAIYRETSFKDQVLKHPNVVGFLEKPVSSDRLRETILDALAHKPV